MATQLVPYNTAMQLGSGFNSFTQTLCIDNAVVRDTNSPAEDKRIGPENREVAQAVTYKTCIIDKTTDVTDEMNINGAFNIKYDQLQVDGSGTFINNNKIKDSDVSIMVSVKVVNQVIYDHSLTKFQPISTIKDTTPQRLVEVYGDSYISGWQEGGEFLAVISIKAKNRNEAQTIAADAKIAFTRSKDPTAESDKKDLDMRLNATFNKVKNNITAENEVSVSVTWTGGGQHLKAPEQDWDFDTMKDVALKFPDLCAKTPMRTHALLTKYTALQSFYNTHNFDLPVYDKTGTYTSLLHEDYLDYKAIFSAIQAESDKPAKEPSPGTEAESVEGSVVDVTGALPKAPAKVPAKVVTPPPHRVEEAFAATITGLEEARVKCRYMMNRIIQEIDNITIKPEIATDETRPSPYLNPFLFKLLLPLGVDLPAQSNHVEQALAASKVDPDALAGKLLGVAK
ncbi:hypothetical protein ACJ41O_010752 [Fusarium nematophilum]